MRSGAHEGLMCPIEKGVSGDWDGSSDAGPELAGREGHAAMESPQTLIAPLKRGCPLKKSVWMILEFNKSSSDDRPGQGICGSKYVEDAKERAERQGLGQQPHNMAKKHRPKD